MVEILFPGNTKYWAGALSGIVALIGYLISGIILINNISNNVESNRIEISHIHARLNDIDANGTRADTARLSTIAEHLLALDRRENARNNEIERVAHDLEMRVQSAAKDFEKRMEEISGRLNAWEDTLKKVDGIGIKQIDVLRRMDIAETQTKVLNDLKAGVDQERFEIRRLDEQQTRIIQALDNTYNTLQEALRGDKINRQPTPNHTPSVRPF